MNIRPIVICLFRHADKILVLEGYDPIKHETFYRPLGGGIEFGETAKQALTREIREELGAEVHNLEYLFTLENIFTFNGQPGHEIVLMFDGAFVEPSLYAVDSVLGKEDSGTPFTALWKQLDEFGPAGLRLYPDGLLVKLQTDERIADNGC